MKSEQSLPQSYKGFSTGDLMKFWDGMNLRGPESPKPPQGMVGAMHDLLRKYRLAPNYWGDGEERKANMIQSKKLLAPFGIDPAPWADQEGNRQPELEAAWHKQLEREEMDRRGKTASS
jgi:hypothetical protein